MTFDLEKTLSWTQLRDAPGPTAPAELAMLNDLQGNILKGHGRHHTSNIFLKFEKSKASAAKHFLASVGHDVTTALNQLDGAAAHRASGIDAGTFIAVLISAKGYAALGMQSSAPASDAFAAGMAKRDLNDPPATKWDAELVDIHAMILVGASGSAWRDAETHSMVARIEATAGAVVIKGVLKGDALFNEVDERGIEHFGYVDGRSQPLVLQEDIDHEATHSGTKFWDPAIHLSQILVKCPGGALDVSMGSYFVIRKLEQNVKGFKKREVELGLQLDDEAKDKRIVQGPLGELAGASVVGRFENGTPVTLVKKEEPLASKSDDAVRNDFDYRDDSAGLKCPFAAHIRKTNPRSDTPDSKSHLMARRGIPYGSRHDGPNDGKIDNKPEGGVGLIFMAYQSDLETQFEFTQRAWANNEKFAVPLTRPGPDTGIDPIIGQAPPVSPGSPKLPGQRYPVEWGKTLSDHPFDFSTFVTMRGGEYLFAPSISFLKTLK